MKLYFRFVVEYDYTRVGYEDYYFAGYSLIPFDKNENPSRGYYEYTEYELYDYFAEDEAHELAKKMVESGSAKGDVYKKAINEKLLEGITENLKVALFRCEKQVIELYFHLDELIRSLGIDLLVEIEGSIIRYIYKEKSVVLDLYQNLVMIECPEINTFGTELRRDGCDCRKNKLYISRYCPDDLLLKVFRKEFI